MYKRKLQYFVYDLISRITTCTVPTAIKNVSNRVPRSFPLEKESETKSPGNEVNNVSRQLLFDFKNVLMI